MKIKLIEKKEEIDGVTSFIFEPEEEGFIWKAGQLMHYTLPHDNPDDRGIERYFTISSAPFEKHIMLTTRFAGEKSSSFKKALFSLPIGSTVEVDGLEGDFTVEDNVGKSYVFIAGGIGITPFRSILVDMDHRGEDINVKLMYGNRDNNFIFKDELEALAKKHPNFTIHYLVSPEQIDESSIKADAPDLSSPIFYISGPEPMVEALEKVALGMGIVEEHLKRDFFPGYSQV